MPSVAADSKLNISYPTPTFDNNASDIVSL